MIEDVDSFIMAKLKLGFSRLQSAKLNDNNRFLKTVFSEHTCERLVLLQATQPSFQQTVQAWA